MVLDNNCLRTSYDSSRIHHTRKRLPARLPTLGTRRRIRPVLAGFSFIKALFPTKTPINTRSEELDKIERVALSIGMSLALVPIVDFILNYTPWGARALGLLRSL